METQSVFDRDDAQKAVELIRAEEQIRQGRGRYIEECVSLLQGKKFLLSGGVLNVFYLCSWYFGLQNLYCMTVEQRDLVDYLSKLLLEQNIERIRLIAACGGDAIYIDDAMSGNDMISVDAYERFCLPYMKEQVAEIHRQGKKAFVVYYGGIADRIEQIVSTGADALVMESTMKSYVNDYREVAGQVDDRMCVLTNLNAYEEMELPEESEFRTIVRRYAALAKKHRKYIISTGSPVTPGTSVERLQAFIVEARQ